MYGFVLCFAVFGFSALSVLKAQIPADAVAEIDQRIEAQTCVIKTLTASSKTLMDQAKSAEIKAECKKVYEALRFSDPMSNDSLSLIESQITSIYNQFNAAVLSGDVNAVCALAESIIALIANRNAKCKISK